MTLGEILDGLRAWCADAGVTEALVYRFLLGLVVVLLVVQSARLWWSRTAPRLRLARQQRRAIEGEHEAEALLRDFGFTIERRQPRAELEYFVDDESVLVDVRADLLVRRDGKLFVAEVKTGRVATQITSRATRRQLLEYAHAFDTDGILLVDADAARISVICVPTRSRKPEAGSLVWKVAFVILIVCSLAALRLV